MFACPVVFMAVDGKKRLPSAYIRKAERFAADTFQPGQGIVVPLVRQGHLHTLDQAIAHASLERDQRDRHRSSFVLHSSLVLCAQQRSRSALHTAPASTETTENTGSRVSRAIIPP